MKKITTLTSSLVLASLLLSPVAFAENQGNQGNGNENKPAQAGTQMKRFELSGKISALDATAQTLTVLNPKGSKMVRGKDQVVVTVNADTKIRRNGQSAVFADLKTSDSVKVSGKIDGDKYVASRVVATTPKFSLSGRILAIDATNKTITVKNPKGNKDVRKLDSVVVYTTADTKIKRDGKDAIFADLKVGDKVEVGGTIEADKYTAKRINAHTSKFELTGTVVSLDTAAKKLTITVKTGNAITREFKGKDVVIAYDDSTKLVLSNGITAIGDLKAGMRVNVKGVASGDIWMATRIAFLGAKKSEEGKSSAKVEITAGGFAPASLTAKVGTKVTWKNETDTLAWPASDPHPVHTGLPGFDALAGLAHDATYSFTFLTAGSFGYHDHLNTSHTGTIVVTP
ncbi:MAG: hypothetical protein A3A80_00980 [Candidatus Terrybacteria bacterium RIFCSPLOWO2_01_FULL_44_24]|uniref:DUF5666 domain-containing protein n=1 Tax=Candidatus Terrybacteria bacterium RIFCSPHIGHO2_01_FULL_43_35 TaxID=1802361 RepID=A0A1G2PFM0_9BACT|nr:MAG: hypothetical protein A2828_04145 [Candidatus Terrybacteria bacterium RIFCSPHIGHO2_01_FULL_43_35]OHA49881.1 MAG: hypothetical protein A3B75_03160 [Candidatus Terrybacteria bacterium RIFCSPHIGHO2_02_FULL_43_14]OHA50716.1 MAG: hypothetical protein A3A80_00980 [Candidatus Terrybacteria bacterium RIFCSPLOWO2_01_FULL_44_24]